MANEPLKTASMGPGFLGVILLFCGFALVAAWLMFSAGAPEQTYEVKRAEGRREKAEAINKEAQEKLYGQAKWIDKAKGTVQLPIDAAMDLVINEYQQKHVQPSEVKVESPYPAGLQTSQTSPTGQTGQTPAPAGSPAGSPAAGGQKL